VLILKTSLAQPSMIPRSSLSILLRGSSGCERVEGEGHLVGTDRVVPLLTEVEGLLGMEWQAVEVAGCGGNTSL